MKSLLLDPSNDLVLTDGDFFYVDGNPEIRQTVKTKLQVFRGEDFYNTRLGAPYTTTFANTRELLVLELSIKNIILDTEGVAEITSFATEFNSGARDFTVSFSALLDNGDTITVGDLNLNL